MSEYTHKWKDKQDGFSRRFGERLALWSVDSSSKIGYRALNTLTMASTKSPYPRIQRASDHSFIVYVGEGISRSNHRSVLRLYRLLQSKPNAATLNIHPAYSSVLVSFNPLITHPGKFESYLRSLLDNVGNEDTTPPRVVTVPVCYHYSLAPDLRFVANHAALSEEALARAHASPEYLVYFLGFSPGFPYMGGLPLELETPRLQTPRTAVPAGSVAIGGKQTGIYPTSSPGGWRIIGRTPLQLFDPTRNPPALLEMGDLVRFQPIPLDEYDRLEKSGAR